jgi:uncharacterized protein
VNTTRVYLRFTVLLVGSLVISGCFNLRRVTDPTRFYVLSALPAGAPASPASPERLAVGLGRIEIPAYLQDRRIAIRQGPHEMTYSDFHQWAERLDKGIQRVVAADLASHLSSDRVVISNWQRGEVRAEVRVDVQQFECDERGGVVLEANWQIASPGGGKTWRAAHCEIKRQGPPFRTDADGAVGELSQALAELSQQIAAGLQTTAGNPASGSQ